MHIEITQDQIDPWRWIGEHEQALIKNRELSATGFGATASFVGTMRDFNLDKDIIGMELSHYPGMTEQELARLINEVIVAHPVQSVGVIHRVGNILPADTIVVVAVWASHRKAAFVACREIMEALKSRAPFWKKEITAKGTHWVAKNTAG